MGNAFNGHCDGTNIIPPQNITTKLADNSNVGSEIKNQSVSPITFAEQEQLNLSRCTYTPKGKNVGIPNMNKQTIAKLYNSNKFIVNNLTVNNTCNLIPRGLIIAWNGSNVPDGWAVCDGTNCTPDLRGRAIYGFDSVSNKNKIGQMGGEENHLLTIGELPLHAHNYKINDSAGNFLTSASGAGKEYFGGKSSNAAPAVTYLNNTKNTPHNNMPPFGVCTYIMKL